MIGSRLDKLKAGAAALALFVAVGASAVTAAPQPSYQTLRIAGDNVAVPYQVWVAWSPTIVPTPDGNAWAFYSAQSENTDGSLGTKKLFVSRYDAATGAWSAGTPLPGGQIQFGQSAAVDAKGVVHVVYTDRADDKPTSYGTLMYIKSTPDGGWTNPVKVSENAAAGHQLSPDLAIDKNGALHVVWQDQRGVDQTTRDAAASNADIFEADMGSDGKWGPTIQVSANRTSATTNASRPQLAVDGDRLVVAWSVYTQESGINTADSVQWSARALDSSSAWSQPQQVVTRAKDASGNSDQIGGRLLDLISDPTGGVGMVFGRHDGNVNNLFAQHLAAGGNAWSAPVTLASGDRGSFPAAAYQPDGTLVVAYNIGSGAAVGVGAVALKAGATTPSVEANLTAGEDGAQGRATLSVDGKGGIWVIYMHEPKGGLANEIRVLKGAVIDATPGPAVQVATPSASPVAAAAPSATPAS